MRPSLALSVLRALMLAITVKDHKAVLDKSPSRKTTHA